MIDGTDRKEPEAMERDRRIELRMVKSTDSALVGTVLSALPVRLDALERFETRDEPSGAANPRGLKGAP